METILNITFAREVNESGKSHSASQCWRKRIASTTTQCWRALENIEIAAWGHAKRVISNKMPPTGVMFFFDRRCTFCTECLLTSESGREFLTERPFLICFGLQPPAVRSTWFVAQIQLNVRRTRHESNPMCL